MPSMFSRWSKFNLERVVEGKQRARFVASVTDLSPRVPAPHDISRACHYRTAPSQVSFVGYRVRLGGKEVD